MPWNYRLIDRNDGEVILASVHYRPDNGLPWGYSAVNADEWLTAFDEASNQPPLSLAEIEATPCPEIDLENCIVVRDPEHLREIFRNL